MAVISLISFGLLHFIHLSSFGEGEGNEDFTVGNSDYFLDWFAGRNGRL
jgi:hypothetical protein